MKSEHIRTTPRACDTVGLSTAQLREAFLIESLFRTDKVQFFFTDLDRQAVAGIQPGPEPVELTNDFETGADFFLARRELGIINVGGPGSIKADGVTHDLANLDCLYIGMGTKSVSFSSKSGSSPARFYLLSTPAHHTFPTVKVSKEQANPRALGSQATANQRKIYQYIHQGGIKSCQLVMGFTELAEGSVWNTMPPHTHTRRTELYFYFDLGDKAVVHLMGEPTETRNLIVRDSQVVLSPAWSIHCGCGTGNYRFIWSMGGENQTFDDMDAAPIATLR